jgi:hypothetical protein
MGARPKSRLQSLDEQMKTSWPHQTDAAGGPIWSAASRTDTFVQMKPNQEHPRTAIYLLLLAIQIVGAIAFVWQELPEFRQVLTNPGEQLAKDASSDLMTAGILFAMQISFWIRLLRIPIPFRRPNVFLNHVLLFLGRLTSF